jgi:glycosyltransferase involved in cell wall biosynthesis
MERERTRYVLHDGTLPLLMAVARLLLTRPRRFVAAFFLAIKVSRRAERPLPVHLVYLAEACRVALWLGAVDHLHAHFGTNSAEVAMLVHALGGPRWSFTIHGPEEFDKAPLLALVEKIRRCAFVVAISSFGRSQLYRLVEPSHWAKVNLVRCGLEPTFVNTPATPVPEARRLVCVGRLCEQKAQLLIVEAARRLAESGVSFELVLAGDGELREMIEATIACFGLESCVRITGWISGSEVRTEVLAARALVLPSFAEGLPVVIMEAMALCRPVISTYVAGIPELVNNRDNGWLVPAGDVDALVEAIRQCLDTPAAVLDQMGVASRHKVMLLHDVEASARQLAELFRNPGR